MALDFVKTMGTKKILFANSVLKSFAQTMTGNKNKTEELPDNKLGAFIRYYQTNCKKLATPQICETLQESLKNAISEEKSELSEFLLHGKVGIIIYFKLFIFKKP